MLIRCINTMGMISAEESDQCLSYIYGHGMVHWNMHIVFINVDNLGECCCSRGYEQVEAQHDC